MSDISIRTCKIIAKLLILLEEGNPNKVDGQIYFVKQGFVYTIIDTIVRFQSLPYSGIQPVDTIVSECIRECRLRAHRLTLVVAPCCSVVDALLEQPPEANG